MKLQHIISLEQDLEYWKAWLSHEEKVLPDCPEDTRPYILNRIAMAMRNVKDLEKALEVLSNDAPGIVEASASDVDTDSK